jgi:hypothetical protein
MANAAEVIDYGTVGKIKLLRKGILHCTGGASRRTVSPQHPSPAFRAGDEAGLFFVKNIDFEYSNDVSYRYTPDLSRRNVNCGWYGVTLI